MATPAGNDGSSDRLDRIERMLERATTRQENPEPHQLMPGHEERLERIANAIAKITDNLKAISQAQAPREKEMAELRESEKRTNEKFAETTRKLNALIALAIARGITPRPPEAPL